MTPARQEIDLDAYFARIGYEGPREPTLAVLKELHRLHPRAIAFEALNAFFHLDPVKLDAASLEAKLVRSKRGGWCFEQNTLFMLVLRQLGFTSNGLAARFMYQMPADAMTTRGHMCQHVVCEGRDYVCDVGLGSLTGTGPLLLEPGLVQKTPLEDNRIGRMGNDYTIEARVKGEWRLLYRFSPEHEPDGDNYIYNYYLATHPRSHFRALLMVARTADDGRWTLNNRVLSFYPLAGPAQKRVLASAEECEAALRDIFHIEPPRPMAEAWDRVADTQHPLGAGGLD